MKTILVDKKQELVDAWHNLFDQYEDVEVHCGDIFDHPADAIVSPANSYFFMNGGIDLTYSEKFGWDIQAELQRELTKYKMPLLVGECSMCNLDHKDYKHLIAAPTMMVPQNVNGTVNVYLATRSVLNVAVQQGLNSIVFPGLGTGSGMLIYKTCAKQMHEAYRETVMREWTMPKTLTEACKRHWDLIN